jgi:hypothetical protein
MKKIAIGAAFLLALNLVPMAHASTDAWWVFCGSCETQLQFRDAALEAPGGDRVYFVSNPDTLESRKFEKWSTYEDFSGGVVQMTHVSDLDLSASEADGLRFVLESANALFIAIDRDELDQGVGSVASDISSGALSTQFLSHLQMELITRGMFPSPQSASESVGTGISRFFNLSFSQTTQHARTWPLRIRINYPDGSMLEITLSPDAQTWTQLHAEDADGNRIPVYGPDSSGHAPVDAVGFDGREFIFGPGSGLDSLLDWLNTQSSPELECYSEVTVDGGMRVTCIRPN